MWYTIINKDDCLAAVAFTCPTVFIIQHSSKGNFVSGYGLQTSRLCGRRERELSGRMYPPCYIAWFYAPYDGKAVVFYYITISSPVYAGFFICRKAVPEFSGTACLLYYLSEVFVSFFSLSFIQKNIAAIRYAIRRSSSHMIIIRIDSFMAALMSCTAEWLAAEVTVIAL